MAVFEQERLPSKLKGLLDLLLEGSFIDRNENVLAFGNPGSGKTHLLCAIGQALIQQDRRVPSNLLLQDLLIAKRDLKLVRILKKLSRYHVLIIDDLGYVQQSLRRDGGPLYIASRSLRTWDGHADPKFAIFQVGANL